MSAFLNDRQFAIAGFLDSGLAELATEPLSGLGDADNRTISHTINTLGQLSSDLLEPSPDNPLEETSSVITATPPLVPSPSVELPTRHPIFSVPTSGDALAGGMAAQEAPAGDSSTSPDSKSRRPQNESRVGASNSVGHVQIPSIQTQSTSNEVVIQAEDYRRGQNGNAYFDTTSKNLGGQYRSDAVDIHKTSDAGGGYGVGWMRQGEWLTYDLSLQSGTYDVVIRASSKAGGGQLELSAGGSTEAIRIGKTNDWQKFRDFTLKDFQISGTENTLRLNVLSGGFNLNYLKFVPSTPTSSSPTPASPSDSSNNLRIEAEDYSSYYDTTTRNRGRVYRNDGVDIRAHSRSSGGFKVIEALPGEWLQYDLSPKAGTYDIVLKASTNAGGGQVELSLGDTVVPFKLKSGKGLGRNRRFVAKGVKLSAGLDTFRLDIRSGVMHLDYVELISRSKSPGNNNPPANQGNNGQKNSGGGNSNGQSSNGGGNSTGGNGNQNSGGGPDLGALPQASFNNVYGYGLVDASVAVSYAVGSKLSNASTQSGSNRTALNAMNIADVWNAGFTGQGQTIAILDTGVDLEHRDLADNIWTNSGEVAGDGIDNDGNGYVDDVNGYDFYNFDGDASDDNGHGTHLAGIIAGQKNNIGITGIAHRAKIMPVKILDADGLGTVVDIVDGIRYAVDNGADVINLSLSIDFSDSSLRNAIKYAYDKGVVVVSAAGNFGDDRPTFPARYADQYGIAVGSVNSNNEFQGYSNKAGSKRLDYVLAPGRNITSAAPGGGTGRRSGTSQSTAQVAGVAALIRSANPALSARKVEELITQTANSERVSV